MNQSEYNLPPTKWQKTVTIIHCTYIDENVSIMIKNDWSSECTGYKQFMDSRHHGKVKNKYDKNSKIGIKKCQGPLCKHVLDYRNKLIDEEREAVNAVRHK